MAFVDNFFWGFTIGARRKKWTQIVRNAVREIWKNEEDKP